MITLMEKPKRDVTYICPESEEEVSFTSEFFDVGVDKKDYYITIRSSIKCPHIYQDANCNLYSYPFSCRFTGAHALDG